MSDNPTGPAAPAPAASDAAPAAPAALDVPTIISPAATPEPVVAEPVIEAPAEPAPNAAEPTKPALHTDTPSLLEDAGKPVEEPKKPEAEAKPAEGAAPTITYEAFKLPEGVTPEPKTLTDFQEIAAAHNLDQDTAQRFVDMHVGAMQRFIEAQLADQHRVFAETRRGWVDRIKSDPTLGGAGHQTALMAAARMRDLLVPEAHRAEFAEFMRFTGAGDHPAMMRLLHTAARLFDEPAAPPIAARPVPDRGGSKPGKAETIYDHPSSRRVAGR